MGQKDVRRIMVRNIALSIHYGIVSTRCVVSLIFPLDQKTMEQASTSVEDYIFYKSGGSNA